MKIFKSLFVLALTAMAFTASATDNPEGELGVKSRVVEGNAIIVQLFNLQQENTTLKLMNLDGDETFFQENIRRHNGYLLKLDLSKLQDGRYIFQVDQNDFSKKQVILVRDGEVQISAING